LRESESRVLRRIFEANRDAENYVMRRFTICRPDFTKNY
jgi:hypothetical protein